MDELLTAVWPVSFRRLCPLALPTHACVVNHARGRSAHATAPGTARHRPSPWCGIDPTRPPKACWTERSPSRDAAAAAGPEHIGPPAVHVQRSSAPAAGSAVVAGSPQAAHRQVRAAVSTQDCSQQAPRRFSGSGSARAMSREGWALREQRGGACMMGSTGSTVSPVSPSSRCRPARSSTWPRASLIALR